MTLKDSCKALGELGDWLLDRDNAEALDCLFFNAKRENGWFNPIQCQHALNKIAKAFLNESMLYNWASSYRTEEPISPRNVGIVMAGNIPAVGFHDLLCVFISGHKSLIKYSDKDKVLIPFLLDKLIEINPETGNYFEAVERLQIADAVIATGSNNSSRYFDYYFSKMPNIIRGNRNSVAVLGAKENNEDLAALGEDVFRYFGLGCRSVSKIFVPLDFNFEYFMEQMDRFSPELLSNTKYTNNFDYNRSVYLLNGTVHWCNDSLIFMKDASLQSRIATLHYEFYEDLDVLSGQLKELSSKIQCIVSAVPIPGIETVKFGQSQEPTLNDYADGADTMAFLKALN